LGPDRLSLSNADGITVLASSGWNQTCRAAHDHGNATVAKLTSDVKATSGMNSPAPDGDKIGTAVEINVLNLIVQEGHLPVERSESREVRKGKRHET
jgi:hypothetical protein